MVVKDYQENYGNGWVKLYRSIDIHWLWQDKPFTKGQAWIDILLECNHTDRKVNIKDEIINCERGESLNSLDTWALRWGWTKSKVRRFIKLLKDDSMIELKSTRKTTHLKVCNYDIYQDKRNSDETDLKHIWHSDETQMTLNKNDKNVKNDKNIYIPKSLEDRMTEFELELSLYKGEFPPEMLREFWEYWSEPNPSRTKMRKELNKTWDTKRRLKTWLKNKDKFDGKSKSSTGATDEQLHAIIERRRQREAGNQ